MEAKDIMTRDVIVAKRDTPVKEIIRLLLKHQISGVPIVNEENGVAGVVTEADLIQKKRLPTPLELIYNLGRYMNSEQLAEEHRKLRGEKAADIMTSNVICVKEDSDVVDIASLLIRKDIKRVFVTRDKKLVGVVSKADILRGMTKPGGGSTRAS
ncbi:MAG: CBS domain-containing protein [Actinomycetota bacterium]|nr:CBS domain-containing protein [Actinomycetota bacterium]